MTAAAAIRIGGFAFTARPAKPGEVSGQLLPHIWMVDGQPPFRGPAFIAGHMAMGATASASSGQRGEVGCYVGGSAGGPPLHFLGPAGSPGDGVRKIGEAYAHWQRDHR